MTEAPAEVKAGEVAFDQMLRERSGALLRTAYLLTGDRALAEDLLRKALGKTYLRRRRLRDPESAEACTRRFMVSTYSSRWRRRWSSVKTSDSADTPLTDNQDVLRRALAGLSRRQRAMVVLRFHGDLSEDETADALGVSVLTVRSTLVRALDRLRGAASAPSSRPTVVHLGDPVPQRTATT